jgi:hypothetical protein
VSETGTYYQYKRRWPYKEMSDVLNFMNAANHMVEMAKKAGLAGRFSIGMETDSHAKFLKLFDQEAERRGWMKFEDRKEKFLFMGSFGEIPVLFVEDE